MSSQIAENPEINAGTWFQQDETTIHSTKKPMNADKSLFPDHVLSRYGIFLGLQGHRN